MKRLIIFLLVMFLTGCYSIRTPLGVYSLNATESPAPKEPKKKKSFKEDTGLSPTVAVLLGIGAGAMLMSLSSATYDDSDSDVAAVVVGGTGLVFWGAAGIVHATEE